MSALFNSIATAFDGLMAAFVWIHPLAGIVSVSALTAILVLIIYKYLSNQNAIQTTKARIKADFLAIMLYKDSIRVLFSSAASIVWANLKYIKLNLVPLLFMILPVCIIMANLEYWHGYRPLSPGEKALVKVKLDPSVDLQKTDIHLKVPAGIKKDAKPLRIISEHEIDWRIEAQDQGEYLLRLKVGSQEVTKSVVAGDDTKRLSVMRHRGGFWESFLYSGESAVPSASLVESISVTYPSSLLDVLGWEMHWITFYFILTLILAIALKGFFKVTL